MIAVAGTEERARAGQDRILARYLRREVMPYSRLHHDELRTQTITSAADLGRIPARRLADLEDPGTLVLRPDQRSVQVSGDVALIARLWWAQLLRHQAAFNRTVLEPVYKPVHWVIAGGTPMGYTAEDVERLAEIGRASLEHGGLTRADSIVSLDSDTAGVPFWQLALGARRAGIATVQASPDADPEALVRRLAPTVVAGAASKLIESARGSARLRALITTDGPHDSTVAAELAGVAGTVITGWAPPGARAMWLTCSGGWFHTWPATEIIQLDAAGELIWTPLQWKGSVLLRTRTGQQAEVADGPCASCGRTSARVMAVPPPRASTAAGPAKTSRRSRSPRS